MKTQISSVRALRKGLFAGVLSKEGFSSSVGNRTGLLAMLRTVLILLMSSSFLHSQIVGAKVVAEG